MFTAEIMFGQFLQLLANIIYRRACAVFGRNAQFFCSIFPINFASSGLTIFVQNIDNLRSSLFWEVTYRRLVVTDVSAVTVGLILKDRAVQE